VGFGLETLDLAAIHHRALSILESAGGTPRELAARTKVAGDFFAAALLPIEATHQTALEAGSSLKRLNTELAQIASELIDSNRELEQTTMQRRMAEQALTTNEKQSFILLEEARRSCLSTREMVRKMLGANEEGRKALSLQLQGGIAQELLGIHIRLLALQGEVSAKSEDLKKEIDFTQRLVQKSVNVIKRILRDLDHPHEP
jgi:hypothetical protein